MDINKMKEYVKIKHCNQKRIQGTPYYLHPFAVSEILANNGYGLEYQIAGLFHDLLEDTNTTYEELLKISNIDIANAVKLVTKEKDYQMEDYINRIKQNEIAKAVKLADRIHNLSEAHYASDKWINKYINETKEWYLNLAEGTIFIQPLKEQIKRLEK